MIGMGNGRMAAYAMFAMAGGMAGGYVRTFFPQFADRMGWYRRFCFKGS